MIIRLYSEGCMQVQLRGKSLVYVAGEPKYSLVQAFIAKRVIKKEYAFGDGGWVKIYYKD